MTERHGETSGTASGKRTAVGRQKVKQWLRLMAMIGREFWDDGCLMRASALTYSTLLSIIPLLALMFSVLKGMGVQNALRPLVLEKLAAGSEEIVSAIVDYINNTDVSHLGTIGLFFLVVSVLALITTIEEVFNDIWGVKETRSLYRRFADFFSVITIGPIFLLAAITMTSTLESQTFVRALMDRVVVGQAIVLIFQVLPFVVMWAAFTGLYIFVPNTRVSLRAAVIGGIFGGTLWQIAEWGYFSLQFGVARYNAIYGAMAVVPIFMVWIYVSWLIVLLGLEVTYVAQHLSNVPPEQFELRGRNVSFASRELAALTVLTTAAEAFHAGEPPRTVECFAAEVGLPPRLARSVVEQLLRLKLLCEVEADGGRIAYQPARSPESMSVAAVLEALREDGISYTQLRASHGRETVLALEERVRRTWRENLANLTVRDLALDESEKDAMEEEKTARGDARPV